MEGSIRLTGHNIRHGSLGTIDREQEQAQIKDFCNKVPDNKKVEIANLIAYLTVALKTEYFYNPNKVRPAVTMAGILGVLNKISTGFKKSDAELILKMCTHRHATISSANQYTSIAEKMLNCLGQVAVKSQLVTMKKVLEADVISQDNAWIDKLAIQCAGPDLQGVNLTETDISDFTGWLQGANFTGAQFNKDTQISLNMDELYKVTINDLKNINSMQNFITKYSMQLLKEISTISDQGIKNRLEDTIIQWAKVNNLKLPAEFDVVRSLSN